MATKSNVEAELKRRVEEAVSYEERASLRKLLRNLKKGDLEPSEALRLASNDKIGTKAQQLKNEEREHEVQNTQQDAEEQEQDVSQVNETFNDEKLSVQRGMDDDPTCESNPDKQQFTIETDVNESSPDEPLPKEVTTHADSRSERRPLAKGHSPTTSEHSEDLLDAGKPQGRRWTFSGAQQKSEHLRQSQKSQDVPFGQSMLKKTDLKPTKPSKPSESTAEAPFGPSTLRRVGSKDSDDARAHQHKPLEKPHDKSSRRVAVDDSSKGTMQGPFGNIVLRQTSKDDMKQPSTSRRTQDEQSTSQFGVVLKKTNAQQGQPQKCGLTPPVASKSSINKDRGSLSNNVRPRASTVSTCRSTEVKRRPTDKPVDDQVSAEDLKVGLAMYINKELARYKMLSHLLPVPLTGNGLYKSCSDAFLLCKLINLSVRGTVDERALSKLEGSKEKKQQANADNLTLALESARSIGCQIDDSTISAVIREDKDVITQLLVDLLKARAVHSKEADQFGSHVFSSPSVLLSLFGVRVSDHKMQSKDEKDDVDAMTAETATTLYKNDPVQKVDTKGIGLREKQKQKQLQDVKLDVKYNDTSTSKGFIPDDKQPPIVALASDDRDEQKVLKVPDSGADSYESRAAARKAARERRRAEKK